MSFEQGRIIYRSASHPDFDPKPEDDQRRVTFAPPPGQTMGLGDLAYAVAHPIGCWIDRRTVKLPKRMRTALCGCLACSARRRRWNAWVPNVMGWKGGWQVVCSAFAKGLLARFLALIDRLF